MRENEWGDRGRVAVQHLMDFNSSRGDLVQYSPPAAVFSDDRRMGEAAVIAQKLSEHTQPPCKGGGRVDVESVRVVVWGSGSFAEEDEMGKAGPGHPAAGLEVAVANLQEYCSGWG